MSDATAEPSYSDRLATFHGCGWDTDKITARQLAALGHIAERPPLEVLEEGSRCVTCSAFVRREQSVHALGDDAHVHAPTNPSQTLGNCTLHNPSCTRLQVRIPLDPQSTFAGLHGGSSSVSGHHIMSLRTRFEPRATSIYDAESNAPSAPNDQLPPLFSLPPELRLQIYELVVTAARKDTIIEPLNRDSPRLTTSVASTKTGPIDRTQLNLLRTCRAVHSEILELLYNRTTFVFDGTKVLWLFLRAIGPAGRDHVRDVDVSCGHREDAIAFALLAGCGRLRRLRVRLLRPVLRFKRMPLWVEDGVDVLFSIRGVREVGLGLGARERSGWDWLEEGSEELEKLKVLMDGKQEGW